MFKSTDGAANWSGAPGLTYYPILLPGCRQCPCGASYAGTDQNGVWKTTDSGAHWAYAERHCRNLIVDIVIDPTNSSTLYAGTAGGVGLAIGHIYKSTNGGATWQQKDSGMPLETN